MGRYSIAKSLSHIQKSFSVSYLESSTQSKTSFLYIAHAGQRLFMATLYCWCLLVAHVPWFLLQGIEPKYFLAICFHSSFHCFIRNRNRSTFICVLFPTGNLQLQHIKLNFPQLHEISYFTRSCKSPQQRLPASSVEAKACSTWKMTLVFPNVPCIVIPNIVIPRAS